MYNKKMNRIVNNDIMKGVIIENIKNNNGLYDGIIKTSNGNKYNYFDVDINVNINDSCEFNMSTTTKDGCDFEAVNIKL